MCGVMQMLTGGGRCAVLLSRSGMLKKHELAALAAAGAVLFVVRADAGDAAAMARVMAWARERLPAVSTYAHAAGALAKVRLYGIFLTCTAYLFVSDDEDTQVPTRSNLCMIAFPLNTMLDLQAMAPLPCACAHNRMCSQSLLLQDAMADLTPNSMWALAAAKASDAAAPDCAALPLRERLLFSSTAAAWSQPDAGHYAAANAALDVTAAAARAAGAAATAVAFGPFGDVGMAAAHAGSLAALGLHALDSGALGAEFAGAGYAARPIRARMDAARFAAVNQARGRWAFLDRLTWRPEEPDGLQATSDGSAARPAADPPTLRIRSDMTHGLVTGPESGLGLGLGPRSPAVAALRLDDVVRIVRTASGEVLGQDLGAGGRFAAGGLDSLAAVELASGIGKAVGRELPSTLAFDFPSVPEAAAHVLSLLGPGPKPGSLGQGIDASAHASLAVPQALPRGLSGARPSAPLLRVTSAARLPAPQGLREVLTARAHAAEAIGVVPLQRWALKSPGQGLWASGVQKMRFGGWLPGVDAFDAAAFGVPAPEAELMDPQQRLLLEVAWEALQARQPSRRTF